MFCISYYLNCGISVHLRESTKVLTKLNEDVYSSKENRSAIVSVSSGIEKENISKKDTSGEYQLQIL